VIPTRFLFHLAEYEGIAIEWLRLDHTHGVYAHTPGMKRPVIVLSEELHNNERELRCVLSHELGHHFCTAGNHAIAANIIDHPYAAKLERLATKWAVEHLIPTDVFFQCIVDGMDGQDLADYFFVTHDYIKFKSELIQRDERYSAALSELRARYNVVF
jgi:Zn-dependent peptidase ImmA (M78 family)